MAQRDFTPYQAKVIKRYYEKLDDSMEQKLSEMVTDLYLAEGKKRLAVWKRIVAALTNLKVKQEQIDHLVAKDDPELLLKFAERLKEGANFK